MGGARRPHAEGLDSAARLEEALAGVKLSGAKHAALSALVTQDQPISLSELAEAHLRALQHNPVSGPP